MSEGSKIDVTEIGGLEWDHVKKSSDGCEAKGAISTPNSAFAVRTLQIALRILECLPQNILSHWKI
jgi:hypothetical protein